MKRLNSIHNAMNNRANGMKIKNTIMFIHPAPLKFRQRCRVNKQLNKRLFRNRFCTAFTLVLVEINLTNTHKIWRNLNIFIVTNVFHCFFK